MALLLLGMVVGIALVRLGWGGSRGAAATGWALVAAALVGGGRLDGAWGVAVASVVGMAAALVLVLWAGWRSPARVQRPVREAAPTIGVGRWPDLGRRIAVFVLTVPVAFAAALWLTFAGQAWARALGAGEADATALTLAGQPVLWSAIMCWQMTRSGPGRMIAPPAAAALVGAAMWAAA